MRARDRGRLGRLAAATVLSLTINGLFLYALALQTVALPVRERPPVELTLVAIARPAPIAAKPAQPIRFESVEPPMTQAPIPYGPSPQAPAAPPQRPAVQRSPVQRFAATPPAGSAAWWPFLAKGCPGQDLSGLSPRDRRVCEDERAAFEGGLAE